MGEIKFGTRFKSRPLKSAGQRRQRVKAQRLRLLAAGMSRAQVDKLNTAEVRETLKKVHKKLQKR